jgi:hypothetical protein
MVTVAGVTRAHAGILEEVGGLAYLTQLLTAMVGVINAGEYGRAIFDTWMRRQLIDIGETVVNNAFGTAPEYGKSGARQRSFARPSASAKRVGTVVLRLRLPNDLPGPVCSWCFCGMLKAAAWH